VDVTGSSYDFAEVRVDDPLGFLWPLIAWVAEIVTVIALCVTCFAWERKRAREKAATVPSQTSAKEVESKTEQIAPLSKTSVSTSR
jgi:type VI protein secretion system component VasK